MISIKIPSKNKISLSKVKIAVLKKLLILGKKYLPQSVRLLETQFGQSPFEHAVIQKIPKGETTKMLVTSTRLSRCSCGTWVATKGALLILFWAHGGPGPLLKRQFGRHAKTAAGNGSNPVRLLKCHVRREKGPTRGPRGPSVAGRGAHVMARGYFSGGQVKKKYSPGLTSRGRLGWGVSL